MAAPGSLSTAELTDIVATTLENRSGEMADNFTNNNILLRELKKSGRVKPFSGGREIVEELAYFDANTSNAGFYSGWDTLPTNVNSPITASRWDIKQAAVPIAISGLEELQNAGTEQVIDLLDARMEIAEGELMNLCNYALFGDGTGGGGKYFDGLQKIVADDPTTSTSVGSINQATWSFWQNTIVDASVESISPSSTTIQQLMNLAAVRTVRGSDGPNLAIADSVYFTYFMESLQAIQRITSDADAAAGFTALQYNGTGRRITVYMGDGMTFDTNGTGMPASHMYFLNTKYMKWRPHSRRNFSPMGGDRVPVNQDGLVKYMGVAGNLTCNGRKFQCVIHA